MTNQVSILAFSTRLGVSYRPSGFVNNSFIRAEKAFDTKAEAYDWLKEKFPNISEKPNELGEYVV